MNLKKSILIFNLQNLDRETIALSMGTCRAINVQYTHDLYTEYAFVPKLDWRPPSNEERAVLLAKPEDVFYRNSSIAIISIPTELTEQFQQVIDEEIIVQNIMTNPTYKLLEAKLREAIQKYCITLDGFWNFPLISNPCGLQTLTKNNDIPQQFIGLHVDGWDNFVIQELAQSRNRICVNLGKEPRSLLYINLAIHSMLSLLAEDKNFRDKYKTKRLTKEIIGIEFMHRFPAYPVAKLKIRPGEAYMAPTENIFHDGCTNESKSSDYHLTYLGHFSI